MLTVVQKIETDDLFAGTLYGNPVKRSSNNLGEYSIYEEKEIVIFFIDRGDKYNLYLFRTSKEGMEIIPGVYPSVNLLLHLKARHKARRFARYIKDFIKEGIDLNKMPDGFFTRLQALLEEKENKNSYKMLIERFVKT